MAKVSFNRGTIAQVEALEQKEGQIVVATDKGSMFVDTGADRIAIGSNAYQATASSEEQDLEAIQKVVTNPVKGDTCAVKRLIADEKYSYTGYVYMNDTWQAMDGNYDATNVYFGSDMVITANIGVQTIDSSGSKTLNTTGKNVKQVFDLIVAAEKNPKITQPSVSVTSPEVKAYEVGTKVTPTYTATLSPGTYEFGPATNVTATSWTVTDTNGGNQSTASGTMAELTVGDDTNYTITAVAAYGDGAMPKTNLGNEYAAGQIKAGSKQGTKSGLTGYRASFYGTATDKLASIDSAFVRGLAVKTNKALQNGFAFDITIPEGAMRIAFAYPATLQDVTSVKDDNGLNAEIKTSFARSTVDVEGADGYTAKSYKVYVYDRAEATTTANVYHVVI